MQNFVRKCLKSKINRFSVVLFAAGFAKKNSRSVYVWPSGIFFTTDKNNLKARVNFCCSMMSLLVSHVTTLAADQPRERLDENKSIDQQFWVNNNLHTRGKFYNWPFHSLFTTTLFCAGHVGFFFTDISSYLTVLSYCLFNFFGFLSCH